LIDPYVVSPHWHGWIITYFYLGGIAAGSYAVFTLASLFGTEADVRATRAAAYLAFPLVSLCGLLLIIDLNRPERFWHMMVASQTFRPFVKWWSPMSIGSVGLSAFGAFSFASFVGVLAEDRWLGLGRWAPLASRLRRGALGRAFEVAAALSAFFLGAYTGTLLSATNQPIWAQTTWLSALFLASSASTGVAAISIIDRAFVRDAPADSLGRLEWLDGFAIVLELALLAAFAFSLGALALGALGRWPGLLIPAFVVPFGLLLPLAARARAGSAPGMATAAAALVLAGGFALRFAVLGMPESFIVGR
jgi:formate-dependent nitrite reductase membrane component NrfD